MRFTLFKTPSHRVFNYIPLYYDPKKERREKSKETEYVPGQRIREGMRHSLIDYRKTVTKQQRVRTIIIFISIILLFMVAYWAVKYFALLWQI